MPLTLLGMPLGYSLPLGSFNSYSNSILCFLLL